MSSKETRPSRILPPIVLAACSTAACMYPVDLARALKMATASSGQKDSLATLLRNFIQTYGYAGLFKQGLGPELSRASAMRISKFFFYPVVHKALYNKPPSQGNPLTQASSGALAVIPETLMISGLEVAKIALQFDKTNQFKNSMVGALRHINQTRGIAGQYIAYPSLLLRQAVWTSVYFASLPTWTRVLDPVFGREPGAPISGLHNTIAGFLAGFLGAVLNTPGDVIRTSITKESLEGPPVKRPVTPG
eukprot:TRINITY_DN3891_c0_g1_i2.p1 TRINITY_DN3891_c0_g1~~TRINITY_DN3891_c0_g1_i2.p1  ORF type:complete len:249 (-),score=27.83 TRINITY_DN3891_c0_g1_i2:101-847(-)